MNIYVVNKSGHNFKPAEAWLAAHDEADRGQMIFLTEGRKSHWGIDTIAREVITKLADSKPDDFLILTSTNTISAIAAALFAIKHGYLNLLLYRETPDGGKYLPRRINMLQLLEVCK